MRVVGALFLGLAFLSGATLGSMTIGLLNAVVFLVLALLAVRFVPERWGENGLVYAMGGAFLAAISWPFALASVFAGEGCNGTECEVLIRITPQ